MPPSEALRQTWEAIGDDEPGVLCGAPPDRRPAYHGITYPKRFRSRRARRAWRMKHCTKNEHLFDECLSSGVGHYLSCDACGLSVYIDWIDTTYQKLPKQE